MKLTPIVLALATLSVAACGGSSSSGTPATAAKAAAASAASATTVVASGAASATTAPGAKGVASTTAPGARTGGTASLPAACSFVTKAQIADAYGGTVGDGKLSEDADNQCVFELSGTTKAGKVGLFSEVSVRIDTRDPDVAYSRMKVVLPTIQKVDLGDEAWSFDAVVYQLHIMKGKYELEVDGPLLADADASKRAAFDLGKVLVAKL